MNIERKTNAAEVPSRVELNDALNQYPTSALLLQVETLPQVAYAAIYDVYNQGKIEFVFNDFAFCEDVENVSGLLTQLEAAEDEASRRALAEKIAETIVL